MSRLARYVGVTVLSAMAIVLVLLLGLDVVFSFLGELEDLRDNYQAAQAFTYVLMTLPLRLYDMISVSALIGGIVGLGLLANHAELTVMRAAGLSVWRIVLWVMQPALLLVIGSLLIAEYVVPVSQPKAEAYKSLALGQSVSSGELWGYWQKQGNTFVQMHNVSPEGKLHGISFYQFSADGVLINKLFAQQGDYQQKNQWLLNQIVEHKIDQKGQVESKQQSSSIWHSELTPDFLQLVTVSPEYLAPTRLYRYADYLQGQGLVATQYFLEFWKKVLAPIATLSMVLVACSFIFGPLRSVTMGLRLIFGIFAGLGFRYLQDFSGYASLVYDFSPLLAAALPIAVCLLGGIWALARVR
ncbi:MAG TPA: LPS export ABC transporter permease LptG [Agitococcus sp.]|nr:LPS export ABC transporter permease LptG [Agitococcus sp.]